MATPRKLKFESGVINPILKCIKKHQIYLTQPENLPQLAKLGYMYNTLWYAGRVCLGYNGILRKEGQNEDNPKYKIEMCEPETEEIDELIYDAWGMHVSNDIMSCTWENFQKIVYQTEKEYTEHEKLGLKTNKTIEDWVTYLMSPEYNFNSLYSTRRRVIDNLLCTIGTGYRYQNGHIVMTASGADQDISLYGQWESAKFSPEIQKVVDKVMAYPEIGLVLDTDYNHISALYKAKQDKEDASWIETTGMTYKEYLKSDKYKSIDTLFAELKGEEVKPKYHPYYPICEYSNITKFDEHTEASYIKAGIEVCEEIVANAALEPKENVEFAKDFLKKFKKKSFEAFKAELVETIFKSENAIRKMSNRSLITIDDVKEGVEEFDQKVLSTYYRCGDSAYTTMMDAGLSTNSPYRPRLK